MPFPTPNQQCQSTGLQESLLFHHRTPSGCPTSVPWDCCHVSVVDFIVTRTPPVKAALIPVTTPNTRTCTAQRLLLAGWPRPPASPPVLPASQPCPPPTLLLKPQVSVTVTQASPSQTLVVLIIVRAGFVRGWGGSTPPGQMVDPPSESQKSTLGGLKPTPPGAPGRGFVSYCANCKQFNSLLFNVG